MLDVLVVSLCKPVIQKLKILKGGSLNIINQWGNQKTGRGGRGANFEISVRGGGDKRGGDTNCDSILVGGNI